MKKLVCLCLFLILAPPATFGQDIPLKVDGSGVSVKEFDQVITVKVPKTVVTSFPFTVSAPVGGAYYVWTIPPGVIYDKKFNSIEVTNAGKGSLTVHVEAVFIDFKQEKVTVKAGKVEFIVGDVPPGPLPPGPIPPVPPTPDPPSVLVVALKEAFVKDGGDKAKLAKLAAVTKDVAKMAGEPSQSKTIGDVSSYWKVKVVAALGSTDLVNVRKVQATYLAEHLPKDTKMELTVQLRHTLVGMFNGLAAALEEVAK